VTIGIEHVVHHTLKDFPCLLANFKEQLIDDRRSFLATVAPETLTLQHRYTSTTKTMAYQKTFFDTCGLCATYIDCSVDSLKKPFIDRLATAVAIPSVSADASYRPQVHKMGEWLASELEALSVKSYLIQYIAYSRVEKRPLGKHTMQGIELELPPIILGRYGSDPKKKTVLVYGHYDVYVSHRR